MEALKTGLLKFECIDVRMIHVLIVQHTMKLRREEFVKNVKRTLRLLTNFVGSSVETGNMTQENSATMET